jgi:hypothetical protein
VILWNYRQSYRYRNLKENYRKIIDIENCIQFYPINTIESIVLKTKRDHDDQQKSCLLPETFGAAKPTQTVSMSVRSALMLLDIKYVVNMSNKNMWWLRH